MKTFRLMCCSVPGLCALAACLLARDPAWAEDSSRGVVVEAVNDNPAWMVRVRTDHPDGVYKYGEHMKVFVKSEKAGYLYLVYQDSEGKRALLFPNEYKRDNRIPANTEVRVTANDDDKEGFRLRVGPPEGKEILFAVVTLEPLKSLKMDELTTSKKLAPLTLDQFKGVVVEAMGGGTSGGDIQDNKEKLKRKPREYIEKARGWAEHHIQTTVVKDDAAAAGQGKQRRVGVFIGLSKFQSPQIRKLKCSHTDALKLAEVMKERCGLTDVVTLINEQATLKNIEKAIVGDLAGKTKPGDLVVIYWSGHGGRCAATTRDEPDGYDEFLVPYDGKLDDIDTIRTTMLMDDTFGRWVQALDGRKVVVILDACHSGGQASTPAKEVEDHGKGLGEPAGRDEGKYKTFFFSTEFQRIKDIGQKEAAVLASSRAAQVSFERREGDLSVFTYYLIEQLKNAGGRITPPQAYENLKDKVPAYVMKQFPGATQTPVFVDQTTPPVYVKP
jgi:hypothetical protein